jgi:hypothetical protein
VTADVDEFEFFLEKPWSDGLPVVTPTEARVQRMFTGTRRAPNDLLGLIPPALEPATVSDIAIHAVMAGCKPTYLPVVLGGLALMLREEFNLNGVQGTMHVVAPLMIVNGPYAQQIGLHGGNGCCRKTHALHKRASLWHRGRLGARRETFPGAPR